MKATTRAGVVLVATVIGVAATARLGFWQLDRASQKLALQAQLEARRELPPLAIADLARSSEQALAQHDRHIVLKGRWLPQYSVFLDNRQMDARQGFFLMTPLELSPGDAVLVQRGWAPRDLLDRAALPAVPTPAGEVIVAGRVAPPPGRLYALGSVDTGPLRQNLDLASFSQETALRLRPLTVIQDDPAPGEMPNADGLRRHWPAPAVDVQRHYGYAFQWFGLCALLMGLYVWFQILQPRIQSRVHPRSGRRDESH